MANTKSSTAGDANDEAHEHGRNDGGNNDGDEDDGDDGNR
jgi:hypothetical protein